MPSSRRESDRPLFAYTPRASQYCSRIEDAGLATTAKQCMREFLSFGLDNPAMLLVPACGLVAALILMRIKKRYVNEGILFRRVSSRTANMTVVANETSSLDEDNAADTRENVERKAAEQVWLAGLGVLLALAERAESALADAREDKLRAEDAIAHLRTLLVQW